MCDLRMCNLLNENKRSQQNNMREIREIIEALFY